MRYRLKLKEGIDPSKLSVDLSRPVTDVSTIDVYGVNCLILKDNKLLVMYHNKSGQIAVPGGHIESGETPIQAGIRELSEELGIKVTGIKFLFKSKPIKQRYQGKFVRRKHINMCLVTSFEGKIKNNEPDKCSWIKFMSTKELSQVHNPSWALYYAVKFLEENPEVFKYAL